jgi:hypothetical protein
VVVHMQGNIAMTGEVVQVPRGRQATTAPQAALKAFHLTNGELTITSPSTIPGGGQDSLSLTGNINVAMENPIVNDTLQSYPASITQTNAELIVTTDEGTITVSGDLTATSQVITIEGKPQIVPTSVTLKGVYTNTTTDTKHDGTLTATWSNPGDDPSATTANASVKYVGKITRGEYGAYDVNVTITLNGAGTGTATITKFGFGPFSVTGSLVGLFTHPDDTDVFTAQSLHLVNQDGVIFDAAPDVNEDLVGTVTVDGVVVATIANVAGKVTFTFTDSAVLDLAPTL